MEEYQNRRKKLVDYANTTNVEFVVDITDIWPQVDQVTARGVCRLIDYKKKKKKKGGSVQIGSLTSLWHDHIACIDDTACPGRKTAFW